MSDPIFTEVRIPAQPPQEYQAQGRAFRFSQARRQIEYVAPQPANIDWDIDRIREEVARVDPIPLQIRVVGAGGGGGVPGTAYAVGAGGWGTARSEPPEVDKVHQALAAYQRQWGRAPDYLILSEQMLDPLRRATMNGAPVWSYRWSGETLFGIQVVVVPGDLPLEPVCGRKP